MTAYYRVGIAQTGGGSPEFRETEIATDTNNTGTLTFTGDIADYDLIKLYLTNSSNATITEILTTPTLLSTVFSQLNEMVFNEYANNQYATYKITSATTWTRQAYRNIYISSVNGLTCTNKTITETEIYNRGSYGTGNVTITSTGLLDYDMIFVSCSYDGAQPNVVPIVKTLGEDANTRRAAVTTPYGRAESIQISDTTMTASKYYYVCGITLE